MLRIARTLTLGFLLLLPASLVHAGGPWSPTEQEAFMGACVEEAAKNISYGKAELYCSCMLDIIMDKYDTPVKAEKYMDDDEVTEMATLCLAEVESNGTGGHHNTGGEWPSDEQEAFMDSCVEEAAPSVGKGKANVYCSCMLDKIMDQYSTPEQASDNMSDDDMESMAADCISDN